MSENQREISRKSRSPAEWEDRFSFWSTPPSESEQARIQRTETEIKDAIHYSARLNQANVKTFTQGSFANRVNVRQDSDVDVCCLSSKTIYFHLAEGMTDADTGLTFPSSYPYAEYKNDVEAALVTRFGREAVNRDGNKAIDVHAGNYLVDADVVACFEYRHYHTKGYPPHVGTMLLRDDNGERVSGFPDQHKSNGETKNTNTSRRYRQQVRIIKTLRNNMKRWGVGSASSVSSFGLESIWWNADDSLYFSSNSHFGRLIIIINAALEALEFAPSKFKEVNNIKQLFGPHNKATPQDYVLFLEDVVEVLSA